MIKTIDNGLTIFSKAEQRAGMNAIILPIIITLISSNILIGLCWILMVSVIYKFIQKEKIENAMIFFQFLKVISLIATYLIIFILILVIN